MVIEAQGRTALRSGRWVYIPSYNGRQRNNTGNELGNIVGGGLFNLRKDIGQQDNLIEKNVKKAEKLKLTYQSIVEKK